MHLLTPPGRGGVAVVVAVATDERERVLECLFDRQGEPLQVAAGDPPRCARLLWAGQVRDEVLVVDRGVLGLELHLHGSPALVAAVAEHLGPLRPLAAGPAEVLLRTATSVAQLRLAIEQMACDFDRFVAATARLPAAERRAVVAAARQRAPLAAALAVPCRVALVGRQNAGKSTFFNRLVLHERVLTGEQPGLTRDPVAEATCLADYPYELVDTAGEGPAGSELDARAMARGREVAAGLRVLVVDGGVGPTAVDRAMWRPDWLVVATKLDLPQAPWPADLPCDLRVTAVDPATAPDLRQAFGELLRDRRRLPPAGPVGGPAPLDAAQLRALEALASAG